VISGSSAAVAGLSNAPAIPMMKVRNENLHFVEPARVGAPGQEQRGATLPPAGKAAPPRLRSNRSAAWPATNTNSPVGRNCTSPTMPRSNALPVSS